MPTIPTHAVAAVAIGCAFPREVVDARWLAAGAVCAMLPDADVIGFRLGVHYGDFLGHRGFSHSLFFAAVLALAASALPIASGHRRMLWLFLFLATASHGLLDALTDGGLGIAVFAPFDNSRYFFPVRPIAVSPIGLRGFVSGGGLSVILSEAVWVWLPSALLAIGGLAWRR
jgi:inner membrane protein